MCWLRTARRLGKGGGEAFAVLLVEGFGLVDEGLEVNDVSSEWETGMIFRLIAVPPCK
jgi:hypothetical protein